MSPAARRIDGSDAPLSRSGAPAREQQEQIAREDPATRSALLGCVALAASAIPWLPLFSHSTAALCVRSALLLSGLLCSVYASLFAARALGDRAPQRWRARFGLLASVLTWSLIAWVALGLQRV